MMITPRRKGESERAYLIRRYNKACEYMSRCYLLQQMRTADGLAGAAHFYQLEAAKYYRYMIGAKAHFDLLELRTIPGTAVRWDEMFRLEMDQAWSDVFAMIPLSRPPDRAMKLAASSANFKIASNNVEPEPAKPLSIAEIMEDINERITRNLR
jgi:hypothetical protein